MRYVAAFLRYVADFLDNEPNTATDPLVALGEQLADAAAMVAKGSLDGDAYDSAQRQLDALTITILAAKATSLQGAAVQVRALGDFSTYVGDARSVAGDEGLYLRTLHSIAGVVDRLLGIKRERWGGDFFLPACGDPHA